MNDPISKLLFSEMTAGDVALAVASSHRILIEFLVKAGIDRAEISDAFDAKAKELLLKQYEDGASQLLRVMSGTVRRGARAKRAD